MHYVMHTMNNNGLLISTLISSLLSSCHPCVDDRFLLKQGHILFIMHLDVFLRVQFAYNLMDVVDLCFYLVDNAYFVSELLQIFTSIDELYGT